MNPRRVRLLVVCLSAILAFSSQVSAQSAGYLSGRMVMTPWNYPQPDFQPINLSDPEVLDWSYWGLSSNSSVDRKAGGGIIGSMSVVGSDVPTQDSSCFDEFTWSNGDVNASVPIACAGLMVFNAGEGFQITVPADRVPKTLKLYTGIEGATGKLEAHLSDASASAYLDTSLVTDGAAAATYTIDFQAGSPGQTLTVTYTLQDLEWGEVTLEAAVLTAKNPSVSLTQPAPGQSFTAPAAFTASIDASQPGSTLDSVSLLENGSSLLTLTGAPYNFQVSGLAAGNYQLSAQALDAGGLSQTSDAVPVHVIGSGGELTASVAASPATVDLTQQGTADWVLFGRDFNIDADRKTGVAPLIHSTSEPSVGGVSLLNWAYDYYYDDGAITYSAQDGTYQFGSATSGIYLPNPGSGFEFSVDAGLTERTVKVYVGANRAQGKLEAYLSDGSAPVYVDSSTDSQGGIDQVYSLAYHAASDGQKLIIRYTLESNYAYGNITLQAVTVDGDPAAPQVLSVTPPSAVPYTTVQIAGLYFGDTPGAVTLNGQNANVLDWSDTVIHAMVPQTATTGDLVVTARGLNSTPVSFTVVSSPTPGTPYIANLMPTTASPGQVVQVLGSDFGNLQSGSGVSLNGVAVQIWDWQNTRIVFSVPDAAVTGSVAVTQNSTTSNPFTLNIVPFAVALTGASPASGRPGDTVVLAGTFPDPDLANYSVAFNGVAATILELTAQSMSVEVPVGALSGPLQVTLRGTSSNALSFSVGATPVLTALSPDNGTWGTVVTITGSGFGNSAAGSQVTFNGVVAGIQSWSDSTVEAVAPVGIPGGPVKVRVGSTESNSLYFDISFHTYRTLSVGETNPPRFLGGITPNQISLVVGDTSKLRLVDEDGQSILGASWSVSDTSVASLSNDDPPVISALAPGSVSVTAAGYSATINIYATAIPEGTVLWSTSPMIDGGAASMIANGVPDDQGVTVFSIETDSFGGAYVRGLDGLGSEHWRAAAGTQFDEFGQYAADGNGGALLLSNSSLVNVRNGRTLWRADNVASNQFSTSLGRLDFAAQSGGDIYFTQVQDLGLLNPGPLGRTDRQQLNFIGVDGVTGAAKVRIKIPNSWVLSNMSGCQRPVDVTWGETVPDIGPPLIAKDGSVYMELVAFQTNVKGFSWFDGHTNICAADYAWRREVKLLRVAPDGTPSYTDLKVFENNMLIWDADRITTLSDGFPDIRPLDLVPDGNGGLLVTWAEVGANTGGDTNNVKVAHVTDPALGTSLTYALPMYWLDQILIGENNQAFAAGTLSSCNNYGNGIGACTENGVLAFDIDSGIPAWSWQSAQEEVKLIAASFQGSVAGKEGPYLNASGNWDDPTQLFRLDATGAYAQDPVSSSTATRLEYSFQGDWNGLLSGSVASISDDLIDLADNDGSAAVQVSLSRSAKPSQNQLLRHAIATVASGYNGSRNWLDTQRDGNKCNIFVHDVLLQTGTNPPLQTNWAREILYTIFLAKTESYPALAGDWASPKKTLGCWKTLPEGPDGALPGDVIAEPIDYGDHATGHVGIVVGPQQTASADSAAPCFPPYLSAGTIDISDYGFRADSWIDPYTYIDEFGIQQSCRKYGKKSHAVVKRFVCN